MGRKSPDFSVSANRAPLRHSDAAFLSQAKFGGRGAISAQLVMWSFSGGIQASHQTIPRRKRGEVVAARVVGLPRRSPDLVALPSQALSLGHARFVVLHR